MPEWLSRQGARTSNNGRQETKAGITRQVSVVFLTRAVYKKTAHQSHLHNTVKRNFSPIKPNQTHSQIHIPRTRSTRPGKKKQEEEALRGPPQSLPTANPTEEQQGFGTTSDRRGEAQRNKHRDILNETKRTSWHAKTITNDDLAIRGTGKESARHAR